MPAGKLVDGQTWEAGRYRLGGSLSIHAPLTVRGCTEIIMPPNAAIVVSAGGSLQLRGTEDCPIKITSESSSPAPGDWRGIEI